MEKAKKIWINENLKRKVVFVEIVKEDGTILWLEADRYIIRKEQG